MNVTPSTAWQERIAEDEAARHADAARRFAELQRKRSERHGDGRALHRKQTGAFAGELTVHAGLPAFASAGLFAKARTHNVWVRCSNGGMDRASDATPDIRGLALKVFGVEGPSALGDAEAQSQDFLLINHGAFAFAQSQEFVEFVLAAGDGPAALLKHLVRRYGVLGSVRQVARMKRLVSAPFAGYAHSPLFSAAPIACGQHAVRVRLMPDEGNGEPSPSASRNWGGDLHHRLARAPLRWALQLQPFVDEATTPIEDASVDWPTPYSTVATLELPVQGINSSLGGRIEQASFDPWNALVAHRPLGEVMRARKVVYFASQSQRAAR